jgi:hypothetical protein
MTISALTSPDLVALYQTRETLNARERLIKSDVTLLRERLAAGNAIQPDDNESNIALILAGDDMPFTVDLRAALSSKMIEWRAIDDAKEALNKTINRAKREAAVKVVARLKPEHDAMMKRLCASLVEVHSAHVELSSLRQELCDKEIGLFNGVCELLPDFIDSPTNGYSALSDFFRAVVKAGYLNSVPAQLRLA